MYSRLVTVPSVSAIRNAPTVSELCMNAIQARTSCLIRHDKERNNSVNPNCDPSQHHAYLLDCLSPAAFVIAPHHCLRFVCGQYAPPNLPEITPRPAT